VLEKILEEKLELLKTKLKDVTAPIFARKINSLLAQPA